MRTDPPDYIDVLVSGLADHKRGSWPLMILQAGYFDDSGSDGGSRYYVLAGFIAPVDDWKAVSIRWHQTISKEPALPYFKMSQAMAMDGQFRHGWTIPLRNKLIVDLVDIVAEINPWRIESFVRRDLFNAFVKGILGTTIFNDPYFVLFYQICLSAAANAERIGWNPDCDFIFDEQGGLGELAKSKWEWMRQNIDGATGADLSRHFGAQPVFRNDITFRPLQAADMFAWLVRDCMTVGPDKMEDISRIALKHLEGRGKTIRMDLTKEMLMKIGASFLVGKARLSGHL